MKNRPSSYLLTSFLLITLLFTAFQINPVLAVPGVAVDPASSQADPGDIFSVSVQVSNVQALVAYDISVVYDAAHLQLMSGAIERLDGTVIVGSGYDGSFCPGCIVVRNTAVAGFVGVAVSRLGSGLDVVSGALLFLRFRVLLLGSSNLDVQNSILAVRDPVTGDAVPIAHTVADGAVSGKAGVRTGIFYKSWGLKSSDQNLKLSLGQRETSLIARLSNNGTADGFAQVTFRLVARSGLTLSVRSNCQVVPATPDATRLAAEVLVRFRADPQPDTYLGFGVLSTSVNAAFNPIRFVDADGDGAYDVGETLIFDLNNDKELSAKTDSLLSADTPRLSSFVPLLDLASVNSRVRFFELPDPDEPPLVDYLPTTSVIYFDADRDIATGGDFIVSKTPTMPPAGAELGQLLQEVPSFMRVRFIDTGASGYSAGETLILDLDGALVSADDLVVSDGVRAPVGELGQQLALVPSAAVIVVKYISGSNIVGSALKDDPKIMYRDNNGNNVRDAGERVVYDSNSNSIYNTGEPVISQGAAPPNLTALKDDPKVMYVDFNGNNVQDGSIAAGLLEEVVYDSNTDGMYGANELVINPTYKSGMTLVLDADADNRVSAVDMVVSETPARAPLASELGRALIRPLNNPAQSASEGLTSRSPGSRGENLMKFFDANLNGVTNIGETIVLDLDADLGSTGDMVVSETPARALAGLELGATLKALNPGPPPASSRAQAIATPFPPDRLRFIDSGTPGYSIGETLVLDADGDRVSTGDTNLSVTPVAPAAGAELGRPLRGVPDDDFLSFGNVRFIDVNLSGSNPLGDGDGNYDIGEMLIFDADGNGDVTKGDRIVSTLGSPSLRLATAPADFGFKALLDAPLNPTGGQAAIKFIDANGNGRYDLSAAAGLGETLVYDADGDRKVSGGEMIVSASSPRAPTSGEKQTSLLDHCSALIAGPGAPVRQVQLAAFVEPFAVRP